MPDIPPPKRPDRYPDRHTDCQSAIERAFQDVRIRAMAAGWTEQDVAVALVDLADSNVLGMIADGETEADIALARLLKDVRKRRGP